MGKNENKLFKWINIYNFPLETINDILKILINYILFEYDVKKKLLYLNINIIILAIINLKKNSNILFIVVQLLS